RPSRRNASAKPGWPRSSGTCGSQRSATKGETGNPFAAYSIAGSKSFPKGSLPNFFDSSTQADTAPGTDTLFQPRTGTALCPLKYSGVHAAGARPDAFKPCNCLPSQTMANASLPMTLEVGSTTVSVNEVVRAGST